MENGRWSHGLRYCEQTPPTVAGQPILPGEQIHRFLKTFLVGALNELLVGALNEPIGLGMIS